MSQKFVEMTHPKVPPGSVFTVSTHPPEYLESLGIEGVADDVDAVVLRNPDDVAARDAEAAAAAEASA